MEDATTKADVIRKYKITYPDGVFAGIYLDISVKDWQTCTTYYWRCSLYQGTSESITVLRDCTPLLILVPQRLLTKILDFSVPTNVKKFLRTLPGR